MPKRIRAERNRQYIIFIGILLRCYNLKCDRNIMAFGKTHTTREVIQWLKSFLPGTWLEYLTC